MTDNLEDKLPNIDTWSIIDTYFRDTHYYKSQHQLDSYNEFIYSETNGIQHIIKRGNPLLIYKEPLNTDSTQFKYEIEIYFGETLGEDGLIDEKVENIFVSSPIEFDETSKFMFPNIARLKGYTYKSSLLFLFILSCKSKYLLVINSSTLARNRIKVV